jgi:hypothetical protein
MLTGQMLETHAVVDHDEIERSVAVQSMFALSIPIYNTPTRVRIYVMSQLKSWWLKSIGGQLIAYIEEQFIR